MSGVTIAKVDCTSSKRVCKAFEVESYPTLILIDHKTKKMLHYEGIRDVPSIQAFAEAETPTKRAPEPFRVTTMDRVWEHVELVGNDFSEMWRFRKNLVAMVLLVGFGVGFLANMYLCGCRSSRKRQKLE